MKGTTDSRLVRNEKYKLKLDPSRKKKTMHNSIATKSPIGTVYIIDDWLEQWLLGDLDHYLDVK